MMARCTHFMDEGATRWMDGPFTINYSQFIIRFAIPSVVHIDPL
jgi:hypothetical protein